MKKAALNGKRTSQGTGTTLLKDKAICKTHNASSSLPPPNGIQSPF